MHDVDVDAQVAVEMVRSMWKSSWTSKWSSKSARCGRAKARVIKVRRRTRWWASQVGGRAGVEAGWS